jgi:heterodisulfide reductase subunit A-like polyferredoxin
VFIATGAGSPRSLGIEGEDHESVMSAIAFLEAVNRGDSMNLEGRTVAVLGGGNAAIDAARTAARLGAKSVNVVYRRNIADMPALKNEVRDALAEGIIIHEMRAPARFVIRRGRLAGMETVRTVKVFDVDGNYSLETKKGSGGAIDADVVFIAVGQDPQAPAFDGMPAALNRDGTVKVDARTLMTGLDGVFAGGDAVSGPATIAEAIGQGKRAAFHIDGYLRGESLDAALPSPLPSVDKDEVLARQSEFPASVVETRELPVDERVRSFGEVQEPLTEDEALASASNCLNCGICSECHQCRIVCPADAVDFDMRTEEREIEIGSVVVSTGFKLFPAELMARYGFGKYKNVITSMQMDRLVAPTRPFNYVLRPGDGCRPANIAYVFCAGSRDHTVNNPICSRVCCMYSMKQAQLLLGALPIADITMYYIDIRAFGKGYDEFYEQTKAMGVRFVKGKVAKIMEKDGGNLVLRYEDIDGGGTIREAEHDLVVLSVGFIPNPEFLRLFGDATLEHDDSLFVREPEEHVNPAKTSIEGVFVAGAATGPMDIPDTILHSGAAAAQTASYLEGLKRKR